MVSKFYEIGIKDFFSFLNHVVCLVCKIEKKKTLTILTLSNSVKIKSSIQLKSCYDFVKLNKDC